MSPILIMGTTRIYAFNDGKMCVSKKGLSCEKLASVINRTKKTFSDAFGKTVSRSPTIRSALEKPPQNPRDILQDISKKLFSTKKKKQIKIKIKVFAVDILTKNSSKKSNQKLAITKTFVKKEKEENKIKEQRFLTLLNSALKKIIEGFSAEFYLPLTMLNGRQLGRHSDKWNNAIPDMESLAAVLPPPPNMFYFFSEAFERR